MSIPSELFTESFVNEMYEHMWKYMDPSLIGIMHDIETGEKKDIYDENFEKEYENKIVFKTSIDPDDLEAGHYVFVKKNKKNILEAFSTYEKNLLFEDDDGVCHGAATLYALKNLGKEKKLLNTIGFDNFDENKKFSKNKVDNYILILRYYKYIIDHGIWLKAFQKIKKSKHKKIYKGVGIETFENDADIAIKYINRYIKFLEFIKEQWKTIKWKKSKNDKRAVIDILFNNFLETYEEDK